MMDTATEKLDFGKGCPVRFNIIVIGETGSGKTTFLNTLLRTYLPDSVITAQRCQTPSKTVNIGEIGAFTLETARLDVAVHLEDSTGYGDFINNMSAIQKVRDHIEKAHEAWWKENSNLMTERERYEKDGRIHCIIYFFSPHRIKDIDREFLKQLTGLAPIVPVIGKADTMNISERREHLLAVHGLLQELTITCQVPIAFDFREKDGTFLDNPLPSVSQPRVNAKSLPAQPSASPLALAAPYEPGPQTTDTCDLSRTLMDDDESPVHPASDEYVQCGAAEESKEVLTDPEPVPQLSTVDRQIPPVETRSEHCEVTHHDRIADKPTTAHAGTSLPRVRNLFAVVCDASASGKREYPWGSLDIYDENHSDTRRLQRLLFESASITAIREQAQEMSVRLYHPRHGQPDLENGLRMHLQVFGPYVVALGRVGTLVKNGADQVLLFLGWATTACVVASFLLLWLC